MKSMMNFAIEQVRKEKEDGIGSIFINERFVNLCSLLKEALKEMIFFMEHIPIKYRSRNVIDHTFKKVVQVAARSKNTILELTTM